MTAPASRRALVLFPVVPRQDGSGAERRCSTFLDALETVAAPEVCVLPVYRIEESDRARFLETRRTPLFPPLTGYGIDSHYELICRLLDRDAYLDAFEKYGRPSVAATLPAALEEGLAQMIAGKRYDLIHVSRSFSADFLLRLLHRLKTDWTTRPKITLDLDEDDARFNQQASRIHAAAGEIDEARWHSIEGRAYGKLIASTAGAFDRVWTSSALESRALEATYGVEAQTVPNSIEIPRRRPPPRSATRSLLFVGTMHHIPNVDAVKWFLEKIWPRLAGRGFSLDIIGHPPPAFMLRAGRQPGVNIHGWVPDLAPFFAKAAVCIAPIRFGAGTRIKLLEYAANNVPIVSTRIAAEGLDFSDGRDIWFADTPDRFAAAILEAASNPREAERRAGHARAFVSRHYDRNTVVAKLASDFLRLLDN